jgi:hypothetical protein
MTNTKNIITFGLVGIFLAISIVSVPQIYATGCPTQFVGEHIQNALAEEAINAAAAEVE